MDAQLEHLRVVLGEPAVGRIVAGILPHALLVADSHVYIDDAADYHAARGEDVAPRQRRQAVTELLERHDGNAGLHARTTHRPPQVVADQIHGRERRTRGHILANATPGTKSESPPSLIELNPAIITSSDQTIIITSCCCLTLRSSLPRRVSRRLQDSSKRRRGSPSGTSSAFKSANRCGHAYTSARKELNTEEMSPAPPFAWPA
jgi:hypothetical protein